MCHDTYVPWPRHIRVMAKTGMCLDQEMCVLAKTHMCISQTHMRLGQETYVSWLSHTCPGPDPHVSDQDTYGLGRNSYVSWPRHICVLAKTDMCLVVLARTRMSLSQDTHVSWPGRIRLFAMKHVSLGCDTHIS